MEKMCGSSFGFIGLHIFCLVYDEAIGGVFPPSIYQEVWMAGYHRLATGVLSLHLPSVVICAQQCQAVVARCCAGVVGLGRRSFRLVLFLHSYISPVSFLSKGKSPGRMGGDRI